MKNYINYIRGIHFLVQNNDLGNLPEHIIFIILFLESMQKWYLFGWENYSIRDNMMYFKFNQINVRVIQQVIETVFFIDLLTATQLSLLILAFFLFQILLLAVLLFFCFANSKQEQLTGGLLIKPLQILLLTYNRIFMTPIIYLSVVYMKNFQDKCNNTDLCQVEIKPLFMTISILNIFISFAFSMTICYFVRSDVLVDNNALRTLPAPLLIQMLQIVCRICAVILKAIVEQSEIRLALLICESLLQLIHDVTNITALHKYNAALQALAFSIGTTVFFDFGLLNYMLFSSIGTCFTFMIQQRLFDGLVTTNNHQSIKLCQLIQIQEYVQGENRQARFILQAVLQQHKYKCKKCTQGNQMISCIFQTLVRKRGIKPIIVIKYGYFMLNKQPIKALTSMLEKMCDDSVYTSCASLNLKYLLYKKMIQHQAIHQGIEKTQENDQLELKTIFISSQQAFELFEYFNKTIDRKIELWQQLIEGFENMRKYFQKAITVTDQMMLCKELIEKRFDEDQCKLKSANGPDILTIRILQIYFSAIYSNYLYAIKLEKDIDDLLKNERFQKDETLNNIALAQSNYYFNIKLKIDKIIILKSSMVKRRSELLSLNKNQLASFMDCQVEELSTVKYINDLLPPFIGSMHNKLIDNYLSKGYSSLFTTGRHSFYLNMKGFIEPCVLHLCNMFESQNDFILNMVVSKDARKNDYIIFAGDGRILGSSEGIFQQIQDSSSDIVIRTMPIDTFLENGAMIQYYMPSIVGQIEQLKESIQRNQEYTIQNQRSLWAFPSNHSHCIQETATLISKFQHRNASQNDSNLKSQKSMNYSFSRFSKNTQNYQTLQYFEDDLELEQRQQIVIDGVPIIILHPELKHMVKQIMKNSIMKNNLVMIYSLELQIQKFKGGQIAYFILQVSEIKNLKFTSQQVTTTNPYDGKTQSQFNSLRNLSIQGEGYENVSESLSEKSINFNTLKSEIPPTENKSIMLIREMNLQDHIYYLDQLQSEEELPYEIQIQHVQDSRSYIGVQNEQSHNQLREQPQFAQSKVATPFDISHRSSFRDSSRFRNTQPLFLRPHQSQTQRLDVDIAMIEQDMQILQEQGQSVQNAIPEEELEQDQQDRGQWQSKSNSQNAKPDVMDKFKMVQQKGQQNAVDQSIQSKTSTRSTTKDTLAVVKQIYDNYRLITPLRKITFILVLVGLTTFMSNIINVNLIQGSLNQLTTQIISLRNPQNVNYAYCTSIFLQWLKYEQSSGILELSPFLNSEIDSELTINQKYMSMDIIDEQVQIATKAEVLKMEYIDATIFSNMEKKYEQMGFIQFYNVFYERLQKLFKSNTNSEIENTYIYLQANFFMRANIIDFLEFNEKMINEILKETIEMQDEISTYYAQNMLIQLFLTISLIIYQHRYWMQSDYIQNRVLLLLSRLSEKQAQEQIIRLQLIKKSISDAASTQWRLQNYAESMFEYIAIKKAKVAQVVDYQSQASTAQAPALKIKKHKAQHRVNTALHSRILKTNFITFLNIIITVSLIIVWSGFLIGGYMLQMQRNKAFQPSLQMTLELVQFKHSLDSSILLGELIKSEKWVEDNQWQAANQSATIELFNRYSQRLRGFVFGLMNQILSSTELDISYRNQFSGLLKDDLCIEYSEYLPFCKPELITLPYFLYVSFVVFIQQNFSDESYRDIMSTGVIGMIATIDQLIKEDFDYEISQQAYEENLTTIKQFLASKSHKTFYVGYYIHTSNVMRRFIEIFQESNKQVIVYFNFIYLSEIAGRIYELINIYYILFGMMQDFSISLFERLVIVHSLVAFVWIHNEQKKTISLRQLIVMIPIESLLASQFKQQIKDINSRVY